jgi:thiamine biosynthesis protein ThiI
MKFVVKYFSEIAVKSRPVRRRFVGLLADNLRAVLREFDPAVAVQRAWDRLVIETAVEEPALLARMVDALCHTPGISYVLEVREYPLGDLQAVAERVLPVYAGRLAGRSFAVRCRRSGSHPFTSMEVERAVGTELLARSGAARVDLGNPEVTVDLEIKQQRLFVVERRHRGPGGYPVGSTGAVLSLISGGFDSPVASYLTMKRGMRTHFLFFNLGGRDHELGVKEVALYLWQRFGCNQRVLFISVPFEEVVAELLAAVRSSQMGVILKRMMLRVGDRVAGELEIDALVTGESVAQVSSQTLRNLAVIDQVAGRLVLRPLVATDKEEIVRIAGNIGTARFAAAMPEYCGVISVNPATRARPDQVIAEERKFDMAVLERAVAGARHTRIDLLAEEQLERAEVEVLSVPLAHGTIIDIRHPDEVELAPLRVYTPVRRIPFYELHSRATELSGGGPWLLYCGRGVMSRLHASHLRASTGLDVKVYAP